MPAAMASPSSAVAEGEQQVVLVAEVAVGRSRVDPELGAEPPEREGAVALAVDQRLGGVQDPLPGQLAA